MSAPISPELKRFAEEAGPRGLTEGGWFYEENPGGSRLGIRIRRTLAEERSAYQKIAVYETDFFGRLLTLDDLVMLTDRDEFVYHEMLTHLPLCSLERPSTALVIGGGDCGCLRELLRHPELTRIVQCEIDERVTRVCERFYPWVAQAALDPRAELLFEDGVAYIQATPAGTFDLVIIDSTDPKGPGMGLFTRDFYRQVARVLRPGGVMVAQTEAPFWDPRLVGAIYGELRAAFAKVAAYYGCMPTYPSGSWTWAYASPTRCPSDYFDEARTARIEPGCRYYSREVHRGAFLLPACMRRAVDQGTDPFGGLGQ